jgi:hypothetical protein
MKEAELRTYATCSACRRKILSFGVPLFYRVTVERFGVDLRAVQRQDGLAARASLQRELATPNAEQRTLESRRARLAGDDAWKMSH